MHMVRDYILCIHPCASLSAGSDRVDSCDCIVENVTIFVLCVLTPFNVWCASPEKKENWR